MTLSKAKLKKLIGYIASIVCLVFLGEPFLGSTADIISTLNVDDQPQKADSYPRY